MAKRSRFLYGFFCFLFFYIYIIKLNSKILSLTCDAAEEPQCGSVTAVLVDHSAGGCLRYWDRQSDGPMELPPAGLHRDDGRDGHPVAQQFHHQFRLNRLSLFYTNFSAGVKKKKKKKCVTHTLLCPSLFCLFVRLSHCLFLLFFFFSN
jgi:hypothetical protein